MVKLAIWAAVAASMAAVVAGQPIEERQAATTSARTSTTTTSATSSRPGPPTAFPSQDPAKVKALQAALKIAATQQDRQAILLPNPPDASNITFQYANQSVSGTTGGTIGLATVANFPAFIGTNVAMAIGFVNACGLNVPHSHPRANEFLTVIQGSLVGGLVLESNPGGSPIAGQNQFGPIAQVNATLTNYKGMLFPQGLTHFQFNPTCEPAVFAAAFDNSDPGRTQIARNFFSIQPSEVLLSATGGDPTLLDASRLDQLRGKIPASFATIIDSCAKRCGISTSG